MAVVTTIIDDKQVLAAFNRLVSFGRTPTRALQQMGRYGKTSTQRRFRNQHGPDFVRWKPSKRAEEDAGETLRKSGRLRNSITYNVGSFGVEWGTNVEYAAAHQFGVDEQQLVGAHYRRLPRVKQGRRRVFKATSSGTDITYRVGAFQRHMRLPARPFLGVNEADRISLLGIIKVEIIKQTGRPL